MSNTTLEELRQQIAEDDQEVIEAEQVEESSDEPETAVAEEDAEADEVDDLDFELDESESSTNQQKKPSPEEAILYKLTKEKKKRQATQTENEELKARLAELEARINGSTPPAKQPEPSVSLGDIPKAPVMYENGIDTPEKLSQAQWKYMQEVEAYKSRQLAVEQQKQQAQEAMKKRQLSLAGDAAKFISEHKLNQDVAITTIQKATDEIDAIAGDGAMATLLDYVGEGSSRVAYLLGRNETKLNELKNIMAQDKTGLKAVSYLTRLLAVKPKTRVMSNAPEPDQPLKGDAASSATAKQLQKQYDEAKDEDELLSIRRKAREMGISLT